jgi:hypothetical protein
VSLFPSLITDGMPNATVLGDKLFPELFEVSISEAKGSNILTFLVDGHSEVIQFFI